ncbi:hypothetical protein CSUI_009699 [Cystoisospora suis]|uniref:Uncharacterized protein n=1 Tax=Cystoisospora suis TaxID=483139 RepID=A0A2C6KJ09_9APIC|nr:hypothetical protein CSUI_009699 [Cystoisospora suis]
MRKQGCVSWCCLIECHSMSSASYKYNEKDFSPSYFSVWVSRE